MGSLGIPELLIIIMAMVVPVGILVIVVVTIRRVLQARTATETYSRMAEDFAAVQRQVTGQLAELRTGVAGIAKILRDVS